MKILGASPNPAPTARPSYPAAFQAWTVVALLIGTAVLSYTDRQVLSLLVDPVRRDLRIDDTQVSLLLGSAFALVYGVAGLPLGYLADRVSRRNLIVFGLVVWSVATIAGGLSRDFPELFASRVFVGLGEAALSPAAIALISDDFPPERRGLAVGFFLSGIAMGNGAAIMIGGAVLQAVDGGALAGTPLHALAPWRLVLVLIGAVSLAWSLVLFAIHEPPRRSRMMEIVAETGASTPPVSWIRAAPLYVAVAMASLVDNAVGAWSPSLLIRGFAKSPGQIGLLLGLLLTVGFGGGVIAGGFLADRAGTLKRRLRVMMGAALLAPAASLLLLTDRFVGVLAGVPLYFALSGVVTAVGFASILQVVPARSRGLAMSVSFFLNVALGAGVGPTAVALCSRYVFGSASGLGPPITLTACTGYAAVLTAAVFATRAFGRSQPG